MCGLTRELIQDTISILEGEGRKVNVNTIREYTSLSKSTIYKYLTDVTFSTGHIYSLNTNNMSEIEKVTKVNEKTQLIYESLEELQDGIKITQKRVSEHTGLNIRTVQRNYLPSFKHLVKSYNKSLLTRSNDLFTSTPFIDEDGLNQKFDGKRDILSTLPTDDKFDDYVFRIKNSKAYIFNSENESIRA